MDRRDGDPRPPIYDVEPLRFLRDLLGITDDAVEQTKSDPPALRDECPPPDSQA